MIGIPTDALGWAATAVLIATLSRQIYKQHQARSTEGVSNWLFAGQMTASVLFIIIYSALVGSVVFVVTNALILLTALIGQLLAVRRRRQQHARKPKA